MRRSRARKRRSRRWTRCHRPRSGCWTKRTSDVTAALRRHGWSYLFVLPTFSLFVVFTLLPVAQGLVLSLQDARVTGGSFIGLANFGTLADDSVFRQALGNTALYATAVVAAQGTFPLTVARLIQPLRAS